MLKHEAKQASDLMALAGLSQHFPIGSNEGEQQQQQQQKENQDKYARSMAVSFVSQNQVHLLSCKNALRKLKKHNIQRQLILVVGC
jgi:hypothetical protein